MTLTTLLQHARSVPLSTIICFLPAVFIAYYAAWIVYAKYFHPLRNIPGPLLACISRGWILFHVRRGDMEYVQRRLHHKYGNLVRIAPNEVACADPEAIRDIYPIKAALAKTDFYPVYSNPALSKYPDHFTNLNERLHSDRRRIVNHIYSLSNILQSEPFIDNCSDLFIQRMGEYSDGNQAVDIGEWFQMYAFDVVGELFFGKMFGFMEGRHDHGSYIESLDVLTPFATKLGVLPTYIRPVALVSSLFIPGFKKAVGALDKIARAAQDCVNQREEQLVRGKETPRTDLLQQMFTILREKGEKNDFGKRDIIQESYTALFAGSDTTAIAIRAVLYFLMINPAVYSELQAEIDSAVSEGRMSGKGAVSFADANKLPYLGATIKEAMRLHPSVGLTMPRHAPVGGLQISGQYIPAGQRIGINAAVIHLNKSVFGEDADQFRPARWLTGDTSHMDRCMLVFGAGTRTCIGKNISLSEIHKLVPQLLREFSLELATDKPWSTHNYWFNKQSNIIVRLHRRNPKV